MSKQLGLWDKMKVAAPGQVIPCTEEELRATQFIPPRPEQFAATKVLQQAQKIVYGDRQQQYGHAAKNFEDIAYGWSRIVGQEISVGQVGLMMLWLKIMRANTGLKDQIPQEEKLRDSFVDIAGYAEATMRALFEQPPA